MIKLVKLLNNIILKMINKYNFYKRNFKINKDNLFIILLYQKKKKQIFKIYTLKKNNNIYNKLRNFIKVQLKLVKNLNNSNDKNNNMNINLMQLKINLKSYLKNIIN